MKIHQLSVWAKHNLRQARILIGICHFLGVLNAIFLGLLLFASNITPPRWMLLGLCYLFISAVIFYPIKGWKNGLFKHTYGRQKFLDTTLAISYMLSIAIAVSQFSFSVVKEPYTHSAKAQFIVHQSKTAIEHTPQKEKSFKNWKQKVKTKLMSIKKKGNDPKKGKIITLKILLIILSIAIAGGLGALVGVWACTLSCNGAVGLSWTVLILGWGGLITLLVIAIKKILKNIGNKNTKAVKEN